MSGSFVAYIDESGDEGFKFTSGSSQWFVLTAVMTRKALDVATVKLVDDVRSILQCQSHKPLHFSCMKHEQRLPYVDRIAKAGLRAASILVHKPSIQDPEVFQQERHRLYRYIVRYLLERVSWFGRDNHLSRFGGDGTVEIVFSNRSGMSYEKIREYLKHLEAESDRFGCTINWNVIRPDQITTFVPSKRMGLQIADAVASSAYYAINPNNYGYTEPRYVQTLKPIIYRRNGVYLRYGLKFWPREAVPLLDTDPNLKWVREMFG
jgi:hypothetical protein